MTLNLRALLEEMIQKDASDLHITAAERPKLRYAAGKRAKVLSLLRAFAPASAVDDGIRKNLRLHLLPTE